MIKDIQPIDGDRELITVVYPHSSKHVKKDGTISVYNFSRTVKRVRKRSKFYNSQKHFDEIKAIVSSHIEVNDKQIIRSSVSDILDDVKKISPNANLGFIYRVLDKLIKNIRTG